MDLDQFKHGNNKRAKDTATAAFQWFVESEHVEFDYVKQCIEQDNIASDLSLVRKRNLTVDAGEVFFVRFIRMKTYEKQGVLRFPDAGFVTCPPHAMTAVIITQIAPIAALIDNLTNIPMDAAFQDAELEQKMPVPVPVGQHDGGEVESHAAAPGQGGGGDPGAKNAGAGNQGGVETEMMALLRVMAKRMDMLEESNTKVEKTLAGKKDDLRVDTFKKLAIRPFSGKELYVGLGSGFLEWGKRFERQIVLAQAACRFTWTEFVKIDLHGNYLTETAERYYNRQVESWWSQMPTLQYVMEKMLETYKTNLTPARAMQLFTAPNDPKRTWPEHYVYLVAVSEVTGGGADYLVLNNVVQYASADLRTSLMAKIDSTRTDYLAHAEELAYFAQAWENETKKNNLGRELVGAPNGDPLNITMKGTLTLRVKVCGREQTLKLTNVYYAADVVHNLLSYGSLDAMGYSLVQRGGRRVLAAKDGERVVFDVDLRKNVLVVEGTVVKVNKAPAEVIMSALSGEAHSADNFPPDVQQGTLVEFHKRLGHLNYDSVERLARDPSSGIALTDHKRVNRLTCAEGKQSKGRQSRKDSGAHSPTYRIGGVICSDLKGPMKPRDRFLAKTKDQAVKKFEHFLVFFDKETKGVARQRSEVNNQASYGEAERMHRTYAAYILNRAPTNANPGHVSPLKVLTKLTPQLGKIVVFGSPCTVYRAPSNKTFSQRAQQGMIIGIGEEVKGYRIYLSKDKKVVTSQHVRNIETLDEPQNLQVRHSRAPSNKNFSQRAQQGMIIGIGEEVKGYRIYLSKDKKVVTSQHVRNIETLDETQNLQVQRLYKDEDEAEAEQSRGAAKRSEAGWTRRAAGKAAPAGADLAETDQQDTVAENVKIGWEKAMVDELRALEENGVCEVVRPPKGVCVLHTKWVYKTKLDAEGLIERLKGRLVACRNEQTFGVNYSVTFAAVIDMTSVKVIFVLARKWRVSAKHGDVLNAYVKADKEEDLRIYIKVPQGMKISEEILKKLGVEKDAEVALELKKALYRLKQAGRLWSKLLHSKLVDIGFHQSHVDMCVYYRYKTGVLIVVGVYVDDLLVTGTQQHAVNVFFEELKSLDIKDLGCARKFLGMRLEYCEDDGYDLDQEVTIDELPQAYGLEKAHAVRAPIGEYWNEAQDTSSEMLPIDGRAGAVTVRTFQSIVGSLLWMARCTRPDIAFAVHKATRRTHAPTVADWKLAKRVLRYLAGTKSLKLRMKEVDDKGQSLRVIGYSDADYAGDQADRKSTTGGLVTVDGMPISRICKKQGGVSLSTMEAEYTAASVVAQEMLGVREFLGELKVPLKAPMELRVDNQAAQKQLGGEQSSGKAKHIDVRIKFVGDYVRGGVLRAEYLETKAMPADLLTKALSVQRMIELRARVGLH
ncbi:Integrase catalytic core protein [Phytophthora palmivora]|uniref:Integrase catalytic core protein n=1 Tax=Phytophthora palmivora TaxID=4796 RepID=A0A2P4XH15_9STRA|nr:Integrase catalytic core protein [Phytophthora palmivora]